MKKWTGLCIGMAVLTALAGCGAASARQAGGQVSSSVADSVAENSSQAAESPGSAAEASSQAAKPSGGASTASSAASSAVSSESVEDRSVHMSAAEYKKNGTDITAEYPQFDGNRYAGVNSAMKQEALSTMNNIKKDPAPKGTTADTSGRVEFSSPDFVSAVFETSQKYPDNAHTFRALRTVNYDLKSDKAVTEKDLFVANNNYYKAVDTAVKKQLSKKYQEYFTRDVILDCIDKAGVYFKQNQIVVSLVTGLDLNDHVEISIPYEETAGFRTDGAVWGYLAKK